MNTCGCGNEISDVRYDLGFKVCLSCGETIARNKAPRGYIHYGHKTAGAIVITSKFGFENYQKVSYRKNKGSNLAYASKLNTQF
jgi:hypothetical protein